MDIQCDAWQYCPYLFIDACGVGVLYPFQAVALRPEVKHWLWKMVGWWRGTCFDDQLRGKGAEDIVRAVPISAVCGYDCYVTSKVYHLQVSPRS